MSMNWPVRPSSITVAKVTIDLCGEGSAPPQPAIAGRFATIDGRAVKLVAIPSGRMAASRTAERLTRDPAAPPDIAVLTESNASCLLSRYLGASRAAIIPVIDATNRGGLTADKRRADVMIGALSPRSLEDAITMLAPVVRRLRSLPGAVLESDDPRMRLLARLFVRDRALAPRSDIHSRSTFVYDDEIAVPGAVVYAATLADLGLMRRQFFDRVSVCPHCKSARLTVREYCARCGGAHVAEQPIIHHFPCAHQALERDFRLGGELVCPKCRKKLKQFSLDYDRPGSACLCLACGHVSTDATVGFVCLDCNARIRAEDAASRTIDAYDLTEAGRACVAGAAPLPEFAARSVGAKVHEFASRQTALGQPFCFLLARLRKPPGTVAGGHAWEETCAFFGQLMRECFTPETEIIESHPDFLVLLEGDSKPEVECAIPEIRRRLEGRLALAPDLDFAVFALEDMRRIGGEGARGAKAGELLC